MALRGDSTNNIPGVAGMSEVTAIKLLLEFGSIAGILANVDKLKGKLGDKFRDPEQIAALELSRKLVSLRDDVEVPELESFRRKGWNREELTRLFTELEFSAILTRGPCRRSARRRRIRPRRGRGWPGHVRRQNHAPYVGLDAFTIDARYRSAVLD
jgi:5'-3' exonuclease